MEVRTLRRWCGLALTAVFCLSSAYGQAIDTNPRQIQSSPICQKIIFNNTGLPLVEPTTHRLMSANGGMATVNINCKISQLRHRAPDTSAFTIFNSGRNARYHFEPDGSQKVYITGRMTRGTSILCGGCSGSIPITLSPGLINISIVPATTTVIAPTTTTTTTTSTTTGTTIVATPATVTTPTTVTTPITIGTSAQFSDCDNQGTCVCSPCPLFRNNGTTINITGNNSAIITTPEGNTAVVTTIP